MGGQWEATVSRVPVSVRDAVERDGSRLCDLWAELLLKPGPDEVGTAPATMAAQAVGRLKDDDTSRILVAEIDGEVVGAAFVRIGMLSPLQNERIVQLSHLQVDPRFLRHGVGRSLIEESVTWAERRGIETLVAATAVHDREANRFMARHGLAQVAVVRGTSVAALRAKLPPDPSTMARSAGRSGRTVSQVVAVRRSQRRARSRDIVL